MSAKKLMKLARRFYKLNREQEVTIREIAQTYGLSIPWTQRLIARAEDEVYA